MRKTSWYGRRGGPRRKTRTPKPNQRVYLDGRQVGAACSFGRLWAAIVGLRNHTISWHRNRRNAIAAVLRAATPKSETP